MDAVLGFAPLDHFRDGRKELTGYESVRWRPVTEKKRTQSVAMVLGRGAITLKPIFARSPFEKRLSGTKD
jgi:hypothetical protein